MPLIVISGLPSSGKSKRSSELKEYFQSKGVEVTIVTEKEVIEKRTLTKNEYFSASNHEKMGRADLKSEMLRLLDSKNVVILDASNYIKGFRYEIYCATKERREPSVTLYCAISKEQAWEFNQNRPASEAYSQEIFDALCLRFEEPNGSNRWDAPLFTVFPDDELNFTEIDDRLFKSKLPKPNHSTQSAPLNPTNYLFELDQITQDVVTQITSVRKLGVSGPITVDKKSGLQLEVPAHVTVSELNRLRRQFLNLTKMHNSTSLANLSQIVPLFVQFLNSNLNDN